ncbi:unnamed protein product [Arctia plantaginis]|uniref:Uncharacterized protein n=1 Tax=Arctia plantaginis TaxID=874455 RepID=A0A8S0YMD4_ARCPL|nr:unnamed protein product [Arctia plantaginis]
MDSLVGYGSDDENESERYGSQQASVGAGASCSFRRRDDDTNYDDVNMDMSEDSQDAESEPELPPAEPPSPQQPSRDQRRGSNDSRERDRERDREFDRKERRRESPGRSRSDRERSDRRSPRRDERYRSDRDRTGSRPEPRRGLLGDRPDDKVPALMDLKPFAGDLPPASDKRSQDARDAVSPRRQLLRKLLIEGAEDEELVLANHSKINLKDCCNMVAEAWSLVTAVTLRRAWNKLKGLPSEKNKKKESEENEKQEYGEDDDDKDALSLEEIRKMIVKIPGCTEVSAEDVGEWMAYDTSDPGFQILNDDEIVVSVREDVEVEVEEELPADVEVAAGPSASEAFAGLETALKWMERQPECDHLQLLTVKRMRDLAARKRLKTAKQLTLKEMFKKQ